MEVITPIKEIQQLALRLEKEGKKIGFVPTMGCPVSYTHLTLPTSYPV